MFRCISNVHHMLLLTMRWLWLYELFSVFLLSTPFPPFVLISNFKGLRHVKPHSSPDFCLLSCCLSLKKSYTSLGKRNCCAYISLKVSLEETQINLSIIVLNWFLPGAIGLQLSSALISMANDQCWLAESIQGHSPQLFVLLISFLVCLSCLLPPTSPSWPCLIVKHYFLNLSLNYLILEGYS